MIAWYETALGFVLAERGAFEAVGAHSAMMDGPGISLGLDEEGRLRAEGVVADTSVQKRKLILATEVKDAVRFQFLAFMPDQSG